MLFWRPAVSLMCPLPVSACSPNTASQQHWHQATGAARPYSASRAQQERVAVAGEQLCMDPALVLPGWTATTLPLRLCTLSLKPQKMSQRNDIRQKVTLIGLNTQAKLRIIFLCGKYLIK